MKTPGSHQVPVRAEVVPNTAVITPFFFLVPTHAFWPECVKQVFGRLSGARFYC